VFYVNADYLKQNWLQFLSFCKSRRFKTASIKILSIPAQKPTTTFASIWSTSAIFSFKILYVLMADGVSLPVLHQNWTKICGDMAT